MLELSLRNGAVMDGNNTATLIDHGDRLCAFIDILGFKKAAEGPQPAQESLLSKYSTYVLKAVCDRANVTALNLSDSTFLIAKDENVKDFIDALLYIQQQSFASGVMTRGGISFGAITVDKFDYARNNFWGRRLYGSAVVEAVDLERALKGMRLSITTGAAEIIRTKFHDRVVDICGLPELRWVDTGRDVEYMEQLGELTMEHFLQSPKEATHYTSTMSMIVRTTENIAALSIALNAFVNEPIIPPEASIVWTDCFKRARELATQDSNALQLLNDTNLVRRLLSTCIGRDWLAGLMEAPSEIRSMIRAVAQG